MSEWRENIERVREALNTAHPISGDDHDAVDASDAALTALTAQIEELERERDAAQVNEGQLWERLQHQNSRAEAAERRVKELAA